jgi:hypothetical protein
MEDKIEVNFKEEWGEGVNQNEFDLDVREGHLGFLKAFLRTFWAQIPLNAQSIVSSQSNNNFVHCILPPFCIFVCLPPHPMAYYTLQPLGRLKGI